MIPAVEQWRPQAEQASARWHVPTSVLLGLVQEESGGRQGERSPTGASGLTQFEPGTAAQYGVNVAPGHASSQLEGAAHYLHDLGFGKDPVQALASYNAGPANWQAGVGYAHAVLSNAGAYHGGGAPAQQQPQQQQTPVDVSALLASIAKPQASAVPVALPPPPEFSTTYKVPGEARLPAPESVVPAVSPQALVQAALQGVSGASGAVSGAPGAQGGSGAGQAAVAFAQAHVGRYVENEGSNRGDELNRLEAKFGDSGEPWCAMFATVAAAHGGAPASVRTASVAQIRQWAGEGSHGYVRGLLPPSSARPGDLLVFGDQHVALVKSVGAHGITTLEGNADGSGGVVELRHGFGEGQVARPAYGG